MTSVRRHAGPSSPSRRHATKPHPLAQPHVPLGSLPDTAAGATARSAEPAPTPRRTASPTPSVASAAPTIATLATLAAAGTVEGGDAEDYFPGALFEYYRGEFAAFPDFNSLMPTACGIVPEIGIEDSYGELAFLRSGNIHTPADASSLGNFALRLSFCIHIPVPGVWTFSLASNDGSMLYISGKQVVANDGSHYTIEREGKMRFSQPGMYSARIIFFHCNGKVMEGLRQGTFLQFSYAFKGTGWMPFPPDRIAKRSVPPDAIFHSRESDEFHTISRYMSETVLSAREAMLKNPEEDVEILQIEMRQMADKIILLQKLLETERKHTADIIHAIDSAVVLPPLPVNYVAVEEHDAESQSESGDTTSNVALFNEHLQMSSIHKHDNQVLNSSLERIERLKRGYFFTLGHQLKMDGSIPNDSSLQEIYENLIASSCPIDQWAVNAVSLATISDISDIVDS